MQTNSVQFCVYCEKIQIDSHCRLHAHPLSDCFSIQHAGYMFLLKTYYWSGFLIKINCKNIIRIDMTFFPFQVKILKLTIPDVATSLQGVPEK